MKKQLFSIATIFLTSSLFATSTANNPVGYWKTIDDATGQAKSIIEIRETPEHTLSGRVMKIFAEGGDRKVCTACQGNNHNKPIIGMEIMSGLKLADTEWNQGHILDPANGKTYKCKIQPLAAGKKLMVRGYIGLPLLGRSQTWERVEKI